MTARRRNGVLGRSGEEPCWRVRKPFGSARCPRTKWPKSERKGWRSWLLRLPPRKLRGHSREGSTGNKEDRNMVGFMLDVEDTDSCS